MKGGSRVCVRRSKGRISHPLSISHSPIKRRRCREEEEDSVCTKFDAYIRKADLSEYFHPTKDLRSQRVKDIIVSDSEFESHDRDDKQLESSESYFSASDYEDSNSDDVLQVSVGLEKKKLEHSDSDVDTDQGGQMDKTTLLFEVQVTVKASHREENVPYVCLTSQLSNQAILGYPVEIQVLKRDVSEISPPKMKTGFPPLVWKTAKRTPVCYEKNLIYSSVSKNDAQAGGNTKAIHVKEVKIRSCVPVGLVFHKILAGIGQLGS